MMAWIQYIKNFIDSKVLKIFIIIFIIFIGPILVIHYKDIVLSVFKTKENAISYLQYFGTLMGGTATLIAVMSTRNQTKQVIEQNSNLIFNQTVIPKFEEIIRISTEFVEGIEEIKISVQLIKGIYDKNKPNMISIEEHKQIRKCIEDINQSCLKVNHDSNMLTSFKMYVNSDSYDTVKQISDELANMSERIVSISRLLPKMYANEIMLDMNNYNLFINNQIKLFNILAEINAEVIKIIGIKNNEIKLLLKKILL